MAKYITVLDSNGGDYGGYRAPVTVSHRMIVDCNGPSGPTKYFYIMQKYTWRV